MNAARPAKARGCSSALLGNDDVGERDMEAEGAGLIVGDKALRLLHRADAVHRVDPDFPLIHRPAQITEERCERRGLAAVELREGEAAPNAPPGSANRTAVHTLP